MREKETLIQLYAEIDLSKEPNEVRVRPNDDSENAVWNDFGYWLEVTGFMAYQAMKYREWSEQQILDYTRQYIEKCIKDYKIKRDPDLLSKWRE